MKTVLFAFSVVCLSACDHFQNDNWQSNFQTIDVGVTGGETDENASNPFGGAFGDNFNYSSKGSKLYWGEDGSSANSHYTPYSVGSSTQYYRGTDDNGVYGKGSTDAY